MADIRRYDVTNYDLKKEIVKLKQANKKLIQENNKLENEKNDIEYRFNMVINSKSFKMISKIRNFKNKIIKKNKNEIINEIKEIPVDDKYYKNYKCYNSFYQEDIDYSNYETDIKTIAFYLPQFHTFKENDRWWGKGFTEWTNTRKSLPKFEGHYQPRVPHKDIGYYKLDNSETMKKQILLAKKHGIYGFCFYYYWFSGKRLMVKPLDIFLNDKSLDFPFCLCWANENWSRTWDGADKDILIKQDYSKNDYKKFINDIKKYTTDERYIKIDNKPVILVYNPLQIPNFKELVEKWRFYAKKIGIGDIYIMANNYIINEDYEFSDYVDAEFDFAPHGFCHDASKIHGLKTELAFNYGKVVEDIKNIYKEHFPIKPFYYSCTMGWDNSARKDKDYKIYYNYSLKSFYNWLQIIIDETRRRNNKDNRYIFINAWNEWAEGTYLEPDEKYGYANINTLSNAIFDLPFEKEK